MQTTYPARPLQCAPAKENFGSHLAQHYRPRFEWDESERTVWRSFEPGKRYFMVGNCTGMALSWIRRVHIEGDASGVLPEKHESIFAHHRLNFHGSARSEATDPAQWSDQDELESFREQAEQDPPTSKVTRRLSQKGYRSVGLYGVYRGVYTPNAIWHALKRHGLREGVTTYLLSAKAHTTAIALYRDKFAFYDPNTGVLAFSRAHALDRKLLVYSLEKWLPPRGLAGEPIEVTEIGYFSGISKRRFRFGPHARAYERQRYGEQEEPEFDPGFLETRWGDGN